MICTKKGFYEHLYIKLVFVCKCTDNGLINSDIQILKTFEGIFTSDMGVNIFKFRYFTFKMADYQFVIVICPILDLSSF